jgi:P-type Ca2+ transporter type 2C
VPETPASRPTDDPMAGQSAHARPAQDIVDALHVTIATGLSERDVQRRRDKFGPNRIEHKKRKSAWMILIDQVKSLIVILLLIASVTAAAFGQIVEGIAIAAALIINAVIGFFTEWKALRSMEALEEMGRTMATVRRDGSVTQIAADNLVPGDVVILSEGDVVPADLRLISVETMECDEATLTGESVPVLKAADAIDDADAALADRANIAFSGTAVTRGAGEGVVIATGMDTEIGKISAMVDEAEKEATPLEKRLERLSVRLIYLVVILGVLIAASGIAAGQELFMMIETAIILAIAAVPEGLPIVSTVALGRGMWRMAKRNALVKHLSAVETLGATTLICTDKTGTLTENRMVLRGLALAGGDVDMVRKGDQPSFETGGEPVSDETLENVEAVLRIAVLCSNADLARESGDSSGDPTEVALLEAAAAAGLHRGDVLKTHPEEREESFNSDTKMMATFHRSEGPYLVAVKGAPEAVIPLCTHVRDGADGAGGLDADGRRRWMERNTELAKRGLRVLAVAERTVDGVDGEPYVDLRLLGLVGLYDPPRETVREAITACRDAGIRVVMVTGDQPATAANIAHAIGLVDDDSPRTFSGRELGDLEDADEDRRATIGQASVFARVSPKQKLDLVTLFQEQGNIVGMTGDGVNDAPALKKSDIGIAMGLRGTEVARETSDIVLRDDAFETIVMAVEQGRAIFENIRRFIIFLLSGNLGQIIAVSAAAMVNAPLPLLPLQILFLNLLLDVFPALAIGVSQSGTGIMNRPPRSPEEPLLTRAHWMGIVGFGSVIAASMLAAFAYALLVLKAAPETAVTMSFLTYGLARLWHTFNMRAPESGLLTNSIVRNPFVWGALVVCGGLLVAAVHVPFLSAVLRTQPLAWNEWAVVGVGSLLPFFIGQAALVVIGYRRRRAG